MNHEILLNQINASDEVELKTKNSTTYVAPIKNRLAYLPCDVEPVNEWMDSRDISKIIGCKPSRVISISDRIGIAPQIVQKIATRETCEIYPPLTLELVNEEIAWESEYVSLESELSAKEIAEFIGRTRRYVMNILNERQTPSNLIKRGPNLVNGYNKKIIKELRELELSVQPDNGWLTLTSISEITGQNRDWIARKLKMNNIFGEERRSVATGHTRIHYAPESIEYIRALAKERAAPAGNWLTATAMKSIIGKTHYWVESRLEKTYQNDAELRQDDIGRDNTHYPLGVLAELLQESYVIENTPKPDGRMTIFEITKTINKSTSWVNRRLKFTDITPVACVDGRNAISLHYDPAIIDQLLAMPNDILRTNENKNIGRTALKST